MNAPTAPDSWFERRTSIRFPVGPPTVVDVIERAAASAPERLALIDGGRTWTYAELMGEAEQLAGALSASGVEPGDRVVWTLPNSAEVVIGFVATLRAGAVWVGLSPALPAPAIEERASHCGATLVIGSDSGSHNWTRFDDLHRRRTAAPPVTNDPDAVAAIAYTSGTTGRPKGVVHTHHNLVWQGAASVWSGPPRTVEHHGTPLSLSILNIVALGPVTAFMRLGACVVMRRPRATDLAEDIRDGAVSHLLVVPTMVHDLVGDEAVSEGDLSTLDQVLIGGAGSDPDTRERFAARFGCDPVPSYGLTEALGGVVRAGRPQDPVSVTLAEHPAANDGEGEICVSAAETGPWAGAWTPMLGYLDDPDATSAALRAGRLHTGDLGRWGDDGRLIVTGRASRSITRGGATVTPDEIEHALSSHPAVREVAVIGRPDDRLGERIVAVLVEAAPVSDEDLRAHCTARLASYARPDEYVRRPSLPRNAMGKVVIADL